MKENIHFHSGEIELEGLLEMRSPAKGVVISHPHPLYGGDMYNPVVEAIDRAYGARGYSTLRFNFRGVGDSGGVYDNGEGEMDDVLAAISYLKEKGGEKIDLAGYSFGAAVNAQADSQGAPIERLIMVSPPVEVMAFPEDRPLSRLKLVVAGSRDDLAPPALLNDLVPRWNPEAELQVIVGADHFYSGYIKQLESVLFSYI